MNGGVADLFDAPEQPAVEIQLGPQAWLLRGFALRHWPLLKPALREVLRRAPLRRLQTPGGRSMSVQTSNCGRLGWFSDAQGYRYVGNDPLSGQLWPPLPAAAAAQAGFAGFDPDACLINRYRPGARMTLHQDRNERDLAAPIVSVSLGLPALFLWGGLRRGDPCSRHTLLHGDVVVWGGVDRLRFHGVLPLPERLHEELGPQRINLTFRRAG